MPLKFGMNAYRPAEEPIHWYNDPHDNGAIDRLYGNLPISAPYYRYPVLIRNERNELMRANDYETCSLFETQFNELIIKLSNLATLLQVDTRGVNYNDEEINIIDEFSKNILCGFNGVTTSKYALQADTQLFADMKEYVEIILNAMLKDIPNAKGTLQRFIEAIFVCEGGAWADLKIMATEINYACGLFAALEKLREKIVNALSSGHVSKHQAHFDDEDNTEIETHVNTFLQNLFSLVGKIKNQPLRDVNIPKIKINTEADGKVEFVNTAETTIGVRYRIFQNDIDEFQIDFDAMYAEQALDYTSQHINEQITIIYQQYTKTINDAVRPSGLTPDDYMKSLAINTHSMIKDSLIDAKAKCIDEIKAILRSFDAPPDAYTLFVDEDLHNIDKTLELKSYSHRLYWCSTIAAHSTKVNEAIEGFVVENIPSSEDSLYTLVFDDLKNIQWIESDSKGFITPYEYICDIPGPHTYLIQNAASPAFLAGFEQAILSYRIIMQEENAFEDDLTLIQSRYFMRQGFKEEDDTSPLAVAIQSDDVSEIKNLLSQENADSMLLAKNIITDLIGRACWEEDIQYEILELMLIACPDIRTALTTAQETSLVEWAIQNNKTTLLSNLIQQSINLNTLYSTPPLIESEIKLPLLHYIAWHGFDDVADVCLTRTDLDINHQSENDSGFPSALHIAAFRGNAGIVKKLLLHPRIKTNTLFSNDNMSTPLDIAITCKHRDCIKLLLSHEPFESVLNNPHLLTLRLHYTLKGLFELAGIEDNQSLEAHQLWAKTTLMNIQNELDSKECSLSENQRKLTIDKINALNHAIQGTSTDAIFAALKLRCGTSLSRYWPPETIASNEGASANIRIGHK